MNSIKRTLLITLYVCIALPVLNFTVSMIAGPYIVGELGGSFDIGIYSVVFFGLGNCLIIPLSGKIGKKFTFYHLMLFSLSALFLTSLLCIFSQNFQQLCVSRFIQGMSTAFLFPGAYHFIVSLSLKKELSSLLAIMACVLTVAPTIGASYGGWVAYSIDWRVCFIPNLIIVPAIFVYLKEHAALFLERQEEVTIDWIGYSFFFLSFFSIVFVVTLGQELDWFRSSIINSFTIIGLISFFFLIIRCLTYSNPILDLKMFQYSGYAFAILAIAILYSGYFGMINLTAQWLHFFANYTPLWIGIIMFNMALAGIGLYFIATRWQKKMHLFVYLTVALILLVSTCFYTATFNAETDFFRIALSRTMAGLGLAFFFYPLFLMTSNFIPKDKEVVGLMMFNMIRYFSGSLGCAGYYTVWWRRKVFYAERLGESLNITDQLTQNFFYQLTLFFKIKGQKAEALLDQAKEIQSSALAIADCFYLMGWVFLGLGLVYIFFLVKYRKSANEILKHVELNQIDT